MDRREVPAFGGRTPRPGRPARGAGSARRLPRGPHASARRETGRVAAAENAGTLAPLPGTRRRLGSGAASLGDVAPIPAAGDEP